MFEHSFNNFEARVRRRPVRALVRAGRDAPGMCFGVCLSFRNWTRKGPLANSQQWGRLRQETSVIPKRCGKVARRVPLKANPAVPRCAPELSNNCAKGVERLHLGAQIRPKFGQHWSTQLAKIRPKLANVGQSLQTHGRVWPTSGQNCTKVGQHLDNFDKHPRRLTNAGQMWPNLV